MQYINLNKVVELDNKILDLILISIDEKLDTIEDKEGVRINGKITIGGSAKTLEGNKNFSDYIDLDIFLSPEEVEERASLKVNVHDFNYTIDDNKLILDISLSINGLKEIIQNFLTEESDGFVLEEKVEEDKNVYINEEIESEKTRHEEVEEGNFDAELVNDENEEIEVISFKEQRYEEEKKKNDPIDKKTSLLKTVFSNKRIKEEVSWKLHCVKEEKTYEEIGKKYNVDVKKLISINKNEKITEGKLIFLPLD